MYHFKKRNKPSLILGNAGRLTDQKGQFYLIELAKILRERNIEFTLLIAGTGELEDELKKRISKEGLSSSVHLLGFLEDMDSFMNYIDVFLLPSVFEGFSFTLLEAMHSGLPIVCFDVSSNPEIVVNGVTGYLVPFPEMDVFADRIQMLAEDRNLISVLGQHGYERVLSHFVFDDRLKELEKYLLSH